MNKRFMPSTFLYLLETQDRYSENSHFCILNNLGFYVKFPNSQE